MGFQEGLDVRWGTVTVVSRPLLVNPQLVPDGASECVFDVVQAAGNIGAVEDPVIIDQLDDDLACGRVNRAVGQGRREGGDGVQVLGPQVAVTAQAEGAEPLAPLVA